MTISKMYGTAVIFFEKIFRPRAYPPPPPTLFCPSTAVMAVAAYTPKAAHAFTSACMPAPPQLSDPAITRVVGYRFMLFFCLGVCKTGHVTL